MAGEAKFTGQTYGEATQQAQSQQAVPTGAPPTETQAQQMAPRPVPGQQSFVRPSERPQEPITAGAPFGAGPGPVEAGMRPRYITSSRTVEQLEALYQAYPRDGILMLLQKARAMDEMRRLRGGQ
jgi:hypothetical protein